MKDKAILVLGLVALTACVFWFSHRQNRAPSTPASEAVAPGPNGESIAPPAASATAPPSAAAPAPVMASQPARLQPVFGWAGESFAVRFKAVHALKGQISREEVESLYAFLRSTGTRPGTLIGGEHVLKNDLMDALCRQSPPPADLVSNLCDLYRDGQQDNVTRDYAVQHIVSLCLQGTNQFAADRPAAREILWGALAETGGSLAGTALLGLHRLSGMDAEVAAARVSAAALKLAREPGTEELTRITALQVCGERRLQEVLPEAASLAKESASLPLRLSAVAALGSAGGQPEKALLEALQASGESPLQPAVTSALRRLNQRLDQASHPGI